MNDITDKISTLRIAVARGVVRVSKQETIDCIKEKKVPKGDVFEMAKAAGLLAVKKTGDVIPDCHPIPIESAFFSYEISGLDILVSLEVKTIYKTGVEVEAMHGVSVAALTMYDMLKPIDKHVEIHTVKLLEKKGGKSDFVNLPLANFRSAVVVCSDSVSAGKKEDRSGKAIMQLLEKNKVPVADYCIIPDEKEMIAGKAEQYCKEGIDLVIFTGGTGLSSRDVTPEALRSIFEKELPALMEAARNYGQQRTPYAMFSRSVAGIKGKTLFLAFPGSVRAAEEYMKMLFPYVLHLSGIIGGDGHA